MFYYRLYGYSFISDIPLFNIPKSEEKFAYADVMIHRGSVDHEKLTEDKTYFCIEDKYAIIRFIFGALCIKDGKEIIYNVDRGAEDESITSYIIGWGLAIVFSQSGHSVFHCSALTHKDSCFLVSGASGVGKSTTSLELIKHGCKYLCDDIAIVDSYENMIIPPAYPIQKVCNNVASYLDQSKLYQIPGDRGKYSYLNIDDYCDTPKPLSIIFNLFLGDGEHLEVKEITGLNKFFNVLSNHYLGTQYALTSFPEDEKFRCLKIAGNIRVFTITRPKNIDTLDEVTKTILQIIDN